MEFPPVTNADELAWPARDGVYDSVGYAILRRDWAAGTTTPVNWADA